MSGFFGNWVGRRNGFRVKGFDNFVRLARADWNLIAVNLKLARLVLFAIVATSAASLAVAQEIGYLDLTDPLLRLPVRSARRFEGGSCGMDGAIARPETTITLIRLDNISDALGQEITFEAKIENTGKEGIEVPWTPHLGDLEPSDATQPYSYRAAAIVLELTVPDSNHYLDIPSFSYGSPDLPGSIRELRPGEWFLLRARGRLDFYDRWWAEKFKESTPLKVKAFAGLVLTADTYTPNGMATCVEKRVFP